MGADAKILGAEKVRTGGIAGFFAKERVEVTVEVDEPDGAPSVTMPTLSGPTLSGPTLSGPTLSGPTSLLDLADSISDVEQHTTVSAPAVAEAEPSSFASV